MKKFTIIITILGVLCWVQCLAQKKKGKQEYEFPAAMLENVKAAYTVICDKGQVLWNINCAQCHTRKLGKKEQIPDFTEDQLIGYELRIANPTHESTIPETNVSAEELGNIMTFLIYKKKNDPLYLIKSSAKKDSLLREN